MKRLIVRIFNLVYLAGAALAIWALCTKPILNTQVDVHLTSEEVADKLEPLLNKDEQKSPKLRYNLDEPDETDPVDPEPTDPTDPEPVDPEPSGGGESSDIKVDKETIMEAFPDGFSLTINLRIDSKAAFDFDNKTLLTDLIHDNVETAIDGVIDDVSTKLKVVINKVAEKYAKEELKKQIQDQIDQYFEGASPVTDQEVQDVYDNVHNALNSGEPVNIDDLATTIVGVQNEDGSYEKGTLLYILDEKRDEVQAQTKFIKADPQPTQAELEEDMEKPEDERKYYVYVDDEPVLPTEYDENAEYYKKQYDDSDINGEMIAEKLAEALNNMPGLVDVGYTKSSPTEDQFNATLQSSLYYVHGEDGYTRASAFNAPEYYMLSYVPCEVTPELIEEDTQRSEGEFLYCFEVDGQFVRASAYEEGKAYFMREFTAVAITEEEFNSTISSTKYFELDGETYVSATTYNEDTQYYVYGTYVNDIDTALANLINQMLGNDKGDTNNNENLTTDPETPVEGSISRRANTREGSKSEEEIKKALKEFIYNNLPLDTVYKIADTYNKFAPYALAGVVGLFIFPWAIFALVTFFRTFRRRKCWTKPGIVFVWAFPQLILGLLLTYGTPHALNVLAGKIEVVQNIVNYFTISVKFNCLIPSFVYCAFIVMAFVYGFFTRPLKVEHKFEKLLDKREKKRATDYHRDEFIAERKRVAKENRRKKWYEQ